MFDHHPGSNALCKHFDDSADTGTGRPTFIYLKIELNRARGRASKVRPAASDLRFEWEM